MKIATQVKENGKRVNLTGNRFLFNKASDANAIQGYASRVVKGKENRIFSFFDSKNFHAIGYTQQNNFIFHVFAGGGPLESPALWGPLQTMTRESIHLRLYKDAKSQQSYGALYTTYNLNLEQTAAEKAYWANPIKIQAQAS
jgi:hypothetical protein